MSLHGSTNVKPIARSQGLLAPERLSFCLFICHIFTIFNLSF